MIHQKNKRIGIYVYLVIVLGLIVTGVMNRMLSVLAFSLLSGGILLIKEERDIWCAFFFLMPMATIFKLSPGSTSLFTYLQLLFVLRLMIKKSLKPSFIISFFVFMLYVTVGIGEQYTTYIKQLCILPLIYYFISDEKNGEHIVGFARFYIVGVLVSSVLGLYKESIPMLTQYVVYDTDVVLEGAERFSALWGDPNYYSVNLILCMSMAMYFYVTNKIKTIELVVIFLLCSYFGSLTASKSFLFMMVACMAVVICMMIAEKKYLRAAIFLIIVVAVVVYIFTSENTMFSGTLTRLGTSSDMEGLTTGRAGKVEEYMEMFNNRPIKFLFGNGIGKGFSLSVPHNTYIDFLDIYGILGSALFVFVVGTVGVKRKLSKKLVNYVPLLMMLIMYTALSMIFYLDLVFQLMLALMIVFDSKNEEEILIIEQQTKCSKHDF